VTPATTPNSIDKTQQKVIYLVFLYVVGVEEISFAVVIFMKQGQLCQELRQ